MLGPSQRALRFVAAFTADVTPVGRDSEGCKQMGKQTVGAENGTDMAPELRRLLGH